MTIAREGPRAHAVFKLKQITLGAKESARFEGKVSFAPMTTRRHHPGRHRVDVLANGVAFPLGKFEVHRGPPA